MSSLCFHCRCVAPFQGPLAVAVSQSCAYGRGVCLRGCLGCPLAQQCRTPLWVTAHAGDVGWPCRSQSHGFRRRVSLSLDPFGCGHRGVSRWGRGAAGVSGWTLHIPAIGGHVGAAFRGGGGWTGQEARGLCAAGGCVCSRGVACSCGVGPAWWGGVCPPPRFQLGFRRCVFAPGPPLGQWWEGGIAGAV